MNKNELEEHKKTITRLTKELQSTKSDIEDIVTGVDGELVDAMDSLDDAIQYINEWVEGIVDRLDEEEETKA